MIGEDTLILCCQIPLLLYFTVIQIFIYIFILFLCVHYKFAQLLNTESFAQPALLHFLDSRRAKISTEFSLSS